MKIRRPNPADWGEFISLAEAESWRVPNFELSLFQGPWSEAAYVLDVDGFCGMVTTAAYEKSAWIGNLVVPFQCRGQGYGTHLFKSALADLVERGVGSVWLTASEQGCSIYEREGFTVVDRVERWVLSAQPGSSGQKELTQHSGERLLLADSMAWGENRRSLLSELCKTGRVFSVDGSIALLQQDQDCQILGPWYSHEASLSANHELLQMIVESRDPSGEMIIDCLASSRIQPLLRVYGLQFCGNNSLMAYGDFKDVNLKAMVSLASLGSVG